MTETNIKALISLLDDPNHEVYNPVTEQLLGHGEEVIPELEAVWENTFDELLQARIENIIHKIQTNRTLKSVTNWLNNGATDLFEGAFLVAQYQFSELMVAEVENKLEAIIKDVWLELNNNLTALEKVKIINHIVFELHKFTRNTSNYYAPQNSYINQVLETKKGNPISLAIIYSLVATRLGLPVYGVNLPKNFILAYVDEYRDYQAPIEQNDILFYINPYNKGAVLGKREIDYFLKSQKITSKPEYYLPCGNKQIIIRTLNNLIISYEKLGHTNKVRRVKQLLDLVQS